MIPEAPLVLVTLPVYVIATTLLPVDKKTTGVHANTPWQTAVNITIVFAIMTEQVVALSPDDTRSDGAAEFSKYAFRSLPKVDNDRNLIGVVSYKDLFSMTRLHACPEKWSACVARSRFLHYTRAKEGGDVHCDNALPFQGRVLR